MMEEYMVPPVECFFEKTLRMFGVPNYVLIEKDGGLIHERFRMGVWRESYVGDNDVFIIRSGINRFFKVLIPATLIDRSMLDRSTHEHLILEQAVACLREQIGIELEIKEWEDYVENLNKERRSLRNYSNKELDDLIDKIYKVSSENINTVVIFSRFGKVELNGDLFDQYELVSMLSRIIFRKITGV